MLFYKETDVYKWMRFKLNEDTLFFNQNKEKIKGVPNKTFGQFIFFIEWSVVNG